MSITLILLVSVVFGCIIRNAEEVTKSLKKDKNDKIYDKEEVHHMLAKKSSTLSEGDGPAI